MKKTTELQIDEQIEQPKMIELKDNELNEVSGGRWVYSLSWCVRDITCTDKTWID